MFEVTEAARAEMAKRHKRARDEPEHDDDGTPLHAQAEGHVQADREAKHSPLAAKEQHAVRHPQTGQFAPMPKHPYIADGHAADSPGNAPATPRPATSWPGVDAHPASDQGVRFTQVGDRHAVSPMPQTTISTAQAERASGPSFAPGTAAVQHLDLTTGSPIRPSTFPVRPPFRTAPTNTGAE